MILEAKKLSCSFGKHNVLKDVCLSLRPGVTAILGPNAAGKSTLIRCLARLLPGSGSILLDGICVHEVVPRVWNEVVSYIPQNFLPKAAITVFEAVLLGRLQQLGIRVSEAEVQAVETLLKDLDLAALAGQSIATLSGGQAQLVSIAQALVREPQILLMDEPTSNLDLRRQFDVCDKVRNITFAGNMTTAITLHDLNLAARCADVVCIIAQGQIHSIGPPEEVLTCEMLESVYRVRARVQTDEEGRPAITILGPTTS